MVKIGKLSHILSLTFQFICCVASLPLSCFREGEGGPGNVRETQKKRKTLILLYIV